MFRADESRVQNGSTRETVVAAGPVAELNAGSGTGDAVAGAGCGVAGVMGMVTVPGIIFPASPFMII